MTLLAELISRLPEAADRIRSDVPMSEHTTFRIGGPADIYCEPAGLEEIAAILRYCRAQGVPCTYIGNGSNILVADRGIRGVVLALGDNLSAIEQDGDTLRVQAGTKLSAAAAYAANHGLAGIEFAAGIPGTMGGAVWMNAGAYEHCMAEIIDWTEYLDDCLTLRRISQPEHHFANRKSMFSDQDYLIYRSQIRLAPDDPRNILRRMADMAARRRASQPLDLPSAGSVFKRPPGYFAGKLISDCGLKGCRVGEAEVSEKHAGFIINRGRASAGDVWQLICRIRQTVTEQTGVDLEPEIRLVGDWQE
ncbi:MAG TPA: hypothetical protein DD640_00845 [Clostridiales bacterium]|nr:hypothetical protein [Clostridiales bacterium]